MFGRGITLFRVLGFEVRLDWSWIIIFTLVVWSLGRGIFPSYIQGLPPGTYWWMALIGAAGLFLSILLHEMGHAVVAHQYGIPIRRITLFIFGGVAEMTSEPRSPKSEFFMAIAGPITSLILAGVCYGIRRLSDALSWPVEALGIFAYLTWMNLVLVGFNFIPAFPLDGGRVLRSLLWGIKRDLVWATRVASALGTGFGLLLVVLGVFGFAFGNFVTGVWWFVIGLFVRWASQMSYHQVLLRQALEGEPVSKFMQAAPITVPASASVRDLVENYVYRYQHKVFPVVNDGHLVGCVSLNQLKTIPRDQWESRTAQSLAVPCSDENTVAPDSQAAQAFSTMRQKQLNRLLVVEQQRLVGIITLPDLLNFLSLKTELEGA